MQCLHVNSMTHTLIEWTKIIRTHCMKVWWCISIGLCLLERGSLKVFRYDAIACLNVHQLPELSLKISLVFILVEIKHSVYLYILLFFASLNVVNLNFHNIVFLFAKQKSHLLVYILKTKKRKETKRFLLLADTKKFHIMHNVQK